MILVWGSLEDPPVGEVVRTLRSGGADVVHLDRARVETLDFDVRLGPEPQGWIAADGRRIPLGDISAIYLRPEAARTGHPDPAASCLLAVASSLDAVVVNRPAAGRSNLSKPFQLAVIQKAGFSVPPTLVTTDPEAARRFLDRHGRVVYKSVSGIRSIVATLDREKDAGRLSGVANGPVQLQRWIDGIDLRVHVVGERWFATAVESAAADYRYARDGSDTVFAATEIDHELGGRLVRLAADMDLLVAGIDLRLTPDDELFCFEVNSSPGFTFYEDATGQPITAAVADLLVERGRRVETSR